MLGTHVLTCDLIRLAHNHFLAQVAQLSGAKHLSAGPFWNLIDFVSILYTRLTDEDHFLLIRLDSTCLTQMTGHFLQSFHTDDDHLCQWVMKLKSNDCAIGRWKLWMRTDCVNLTTGSDQNSETIKHAKNCGKEIKWKELLRCAVSRLSLRVTHITA